LFYSHRDERFTGGVTWQGAARTPQPVRHEELETANGWKHKLAGPTRGARRNAGDSDHHGCAPQLMCCNYPEKTPQKMAKTLTN
jgi:hypothetical protein